MTKNRRKGMSAEQALRESEQRFRDIAEAGSDWFWETDPDHRFSWFAGHETMVTGDPEKRGLGKTRFDMRMPDDDDGAKWDAHRADLDAHRHFKDFVFPLEADDGSTHYVRVSGKPVFTDDGEFLGHRGTASDITSFVAADDRARSAQERLGIAIEGLSELFLLFDAEGGLVIGNRTWRELNRPIADQIRPGATFEDILRASIRAGLLPEARGQEEEWLRARLERHRNPKGPFEIERPEGRWVLVNDHPLPDGGIITVATDITEIKKAEVAFRTLNAELEQRIEERTRDLADKTALLEATFESISEGFALYDADDRLVFCDEAYLRNAGLIASLIKPGVRFETLIRRNIELGFVDFKGESAEAKLRTRMARHRNPSGNLEHRSLDGKWLLISERKTPDGGIALVQTDITDRKEIEAGLIQARERADAANRAKSEFLSRMSHELRTPMNAILGFGQILQADPEEPLSPTQSMAVEEILKGGHHLLELINEVLDLASVESGKVVQSIEAVDPGTVMESCLTLAEPLADERRIELINRAAGTNLARVWADETRFRQVLLNLVSNAVKYNRDGGVVTVDAEETDDGFLRVSVADTGPGIAVEEQDQLFEPFSRLGAKGGKIEGTGIGLTITKQLIKLMKGRIGFVSSLGRGSVFWIELPLAAGDKSNRDDAKRAAVSRIADEARGLGEDHLVLYVEDDPASLKLMETIVARLTNLTLISAVTAESALELAQARRPDLILMDIDLPGMNGIEAFEHLRADDKTRDIPMIAISANAMSEQIRKAAEAGLLHYLTKPIKVGKLMSAIKQATAEMSGARPGNERPAS